jgi:hypothetical protein
MSSEIVALGLELVLLAEGLIQALKQAPVAIRHDALGSSSALQLCVGFKGGCDDGGEDASRRPRKL